MRKGKINWALLLGLFVVIVVLSVTAVSLWYWNRSNRAETGLTEGLKAYDQGDWVSATEQLGRYLSINKEDAEILNKYATSLINRPPQKGMNFIPNAINIFNRVLRFDDTKCTPEQRKYAAEKLVNLYLSFGNMAEEARIKAQQQYEKAPDNDIRMLLAKAHLQAAVRSGSDVITERELEHYAEAKKLLNEILAEDKSEIMAYAILGQISDFEKKRATVDQPYDGTPPGQWFDMAVKENPDSAKAYIVRAIWKSPEIIKAKTDFDRAQYALDEARVKLDRIKDNSDTSRQDLDNATAVYDDAQEDLDKARDVYELSLADLNMAETLDLSDSTTRLELAVTLQRISMFKKADSHFKKVIENDPQNLSAWNNWAKMVMNQVIEKDQADQETKEKKIAVAQGGLDTLKDKRFHFLPVAAELFIQAEKFDSAAQCIQQLDEFELFPDQVARLNGMLASAEGHFYQAIQYWNEAIVKGMDTEEINLNIASAYIDLDDKKSAINRLKLFVNKNGKSYRGNLMLARLLSDQGDYPEAVEKARIAFRLIVPDLSKFALNNTTIGAFITYIETRIHLLRTTDNPENSILWQNVERDLGILYNALPDSLAINMMKFETARHQKKLLEAEKILLEIQKLEPGSQAVKNAQIELMLSRYQVKEQAAQEILDKKDEFGPDSPEVKQALVELKEAQEIKLKITEMLEQNAVQNPSLNSLKYIVADYIKNNEYEKATSIIEQSIGKIQDQTSTQYRDTVSMLCDLLYFIKDYENAGDTLNDLYKKFPDDISVIRRKIRHDKALANNHILAGENSKAASIFKAVQPMVDKIKSIEGPDGWQWKYEQAALWLESDDFKDNYNKLIDLIKENISLNPDDIPSRMVLAAAYDKGQDNQLALSTYQQILDKDPENINVMRMYASALQKNDRMAEADRIFEKAKSLKIEDSYLKELELQGYIQRKQFESASTILENELKQQPDDFRNKLNLASINIIQQKVDEANSILEELWNQHKDSKENALLIAGSYVPFLLSQDRLDRALEICNVLVNQYAGRNAYYLRSTVYEKSNRQSEAEQDLLKAISEYDDPVKGHIDLSLFYNRIGKKDQAISTIMQAVQDKPDDFLVLKQAIILTLTSENADTRQKGLLLLDKGLELNPDDLQLALFKIDALRREDSAESIQQAYKMATDLTQNDKHKKRPEPWIVLIEIHRQQGDIGKALDTAAMGLAVTGGSREITLAKARAEAVHSPLYAIATLRMFFEKNPDDYEVAMLLADMYNSSKDSRKAIQLLESIIKKVNTPDLQRYIQTRIAASYYCDGQVGEAEKLFAQLEADEPGDILPVAEKTRILIIKKQWPELVEVAGKWFADNPEDMQLYDRIVADLTSSYKQTLESRQAAKDIMRVKLKANPDDIETMFDLAILLQTEGQINESVTLYRQIVQKVPDGIVAINNLAWMLCEDLKQYDEAFQLVEKGLAVNPDYMDLLDTKGMVLFRQNKLQEAADIFNRSLTLYKSNDFGIAGTHYHLGLVYYAQGNQQKARQHLETAIQLEENRKRLAIDNVYSIPYLAPQDVVDAEKILEELK